jgi:amidase
MTAGDYLLGIEQLQRVSRQVAGFFERYDLWLTPTLGGPPPPLGELTSTTSDPLAAATASGRVLMFDCELANVTGNPAISLPFGRDARGLPLGIHLLGRFGDEATLLRVAGQVERAHPWSYATVTAS